MKTCRIVFNPGIFFKFITALSQSFSSATLEQIRIRCFGKEVLNIILSVDLFQKSACWYVCYHL